MSHRFLTALGALALTTGPIAPASAQSTATAEASNPAAVELKSDVKVIREVTENGATREALEEPRQVVPGDRLVFVTHYTNRGAQPATDFVVTNPLPAPVKLNRAEGAEVSVDGGQTFGALAALKVTGADGTERAAQAGDVTHVRWRLASIAPGGSGELTYFGEVR